jgi:hypothetical protein
MTDDALSRRGHALEEEYFRRKDRELIEKLRQAAAADRARNDMAVRIGSDDPEMLQELQALGFTPDTVALLPLVPVVQMAWADGSVAAAETALIVKLARSRGIVEGTAADAVLSEWLRRAPDPQVVASATRLIRGMLAAQPSDQPDLTVDDLVRYCESIAEASGGIFGINRISAEERALLTTIAAALKGR